MSRAEHVVWDTSAPRAPHTLQPDEQLVLRCNHCGDRYIVTLPASVALVGGICKLYAKDHARCRRPNGSGGKRRP